MKIDIINCFCTQEANSGNPAAIVRNFTETKPEKQKLSVPLKSFELLDVLKPNFDWIAEWSKKNTVNGLYVYTKDVSNNDFNFCARGFNPKAGHQEDAATGVAAAALSLALKHNIVVRHQDDQYDFMINKKASEI